MEKFGVNYEVSFFQRGPSIGRIWLGFSKKKKQKKPWNLHQKNGFFDVKCFTDDIIILCTRGSQRIAFSSVEFALVRQGFVNIEKYSFAFRRDKCLKIKKKKKEKKTKNIYEREAVESKGEARKNKCFVKSNEIDRDPVRTRKSVHGFTSRLMALANTRLTRNESKKSTKILFLAKRTSTAISYNFRALENDELSSDQCTRLSDCSAKRRTASLSIRYRYNVEDEQFATMKVLRRVFFSLLKQSVYRSETFPLSISFTFVAVSTRIVLNGWKFQDGFDRFKKLETAKKIEFSIMHKQREHVPKRSIWTASFFTWTPLFFFPSFFLSLFYKSYTLSSIFFLLFCRLSIRTFSRVKIIYLTLLVF